MVLFQAKQKKNNRKAKDKERNEKHEVKILERLRDETAVDDNDSLPAKEVEMRAKGDALEDCASDGSDISTRLVNLKQVVHCFLIKNAFCANWTSMQGEESSQQGLKHYQLCRRS